MIKQPHLLKEDKRRSKEKPENGQIGLKKACLQRTRSWRFP